MISSRFLAEEDDFEEFNPSPNPSLPVASDDDDDDKEKLFEPDFVDVDELLASDDETALDWIIVTDEDGDFTGDDCGKAVELYNAVHNIATRDGVDVESFASKFVERAVERDGISVKEIYALAKETDSPGYQEILREAFERIGYEIAKDWSEEDHPRDEDGKFSSSGGGGGGGGGGSSGGGSDADVAIGGGAQMVSPSVATGLSLDEAARELHSVRQREVMGEAHKVDAILGLETTQSPAVGAWADGAENSIVVRVSNKATHEEIRTSAAMKGMIADQKAVIPFHVEKDGPDSMYWFDAQTKDLGELHTGLGKQGVEYHTLEPRGSSTRVWVFDQGSKLEATMEKAGEHYGQAIRRVTGRGEILGSWDSRAEGRAAYQAVIDKNLGPDQRARWDGLYSRWRETHPIQNAFRKEGRRRKVVWLLKWDEEQHPRDEDGQFASGDGGGGADDTSISSGGPEVGGGGATQEQPSARTPAKQYPPSTKVQGCDTLNPVRPGSIDKAEEKLTLEGYSPNTMRESSAALMEYAKDHPEVWKEGSEWYDKEHGLARSIGAKVGLEVNEGAAMLAATSPRVPVDRARAAAAAAADAIAADSSITVTKEIIENRYQKALAYAETLKGAKAEKARAAAEVNRERWLANDIGKTYDVLTGDPKQVGAWHPARGTAMTDGWTKAIRIARGENPDDVMSGAKVRSFWSNMRKPGESAGVTIDTWMVKAITGNHELKEGDMSQLLGRSSGKQTSGRYEVFSRRVRETAHDYKVSPLKAQAIMWTAIQHQRVNTPKAPKAPKAPKPKKAA